MQKVCSFLAEGLRWLGYGIVDAAVVARQQQALIKLDWVSTKQTTPSTSEATDDDDGHFYLANLGWQKNNLINLVRAGTINTLPPLSF